MPCERRRAGAPEKLSCFRRPLPLAADYVEDGRLAGVVAVNAPRAFTVACRTLLTEPVLAPVPVPVTVPEPVRFEDHPPLRLVR